MKFKKGDIIQVIFNSKVLSNYNRIYHIITVSKRYKTYKALLLNHEYIMEDVLDHDWIDEEAILLGTVKNIDLIKTLYF